MSRGTSAGSGPQWSKGLDTRVSAHIDDSMLTILAHDHTHTAAGSDGLQVSDRSQADQFNADQIDWT